ncbi:hypothetical protein LSAT2_017273 [Lamellibrachia satsuma]|nr:hypothetical protein LSAT2_017273 [Lamellibrachia satsuma]
MMESVVPDETTAVSADVVGEMAAAAEIAHEVATPVASGQMTERAPQIIPDIVVEMVSDVFIPVASETPTEMIPNKDKKMSSEFETYMASEVLVPIKKEMELTASAMLIPLEFEMKKTFFSERYGAEPTASEEKMLVTPEMKAESPPEVKEQMTPELAETIISVAENPITSEPMATAAPETETSMAAETPGDMTPVISDTMVFMASETSFSETSVVMESDTSEVVEQMVSEVKTGMASQEKMSVASEMDGVMASEGITISVPEKKLVVPEMTVVTLALPGEEEMSSMKAPTVETTPEVDSSSSQLVEEPKAGKTSKKCVKQVKKQTATKRTRKAVQPKAKRNNKTKNSATESEPISIDSGDDANIPYNFEDSSVLYDAGDDVVVETGTKAQSVTKPENVGEATPLNKTTTPFNNTTNTRKRHKTGPGAIPSKRQKKGKSQQADVCQADGDAEAGSCVPCLPLEIITSLLRQLAGSKSNDKPEVDPQCPLQTPSEVLQDYSFVICQCDVKKNQNTYFICQVLQTSAEEAYVWYRCGRMGQVSKKSLMGPISPHIAAIVEFTRMYQNKTGHNWFWSSVDERRRPKVDSYGELDIDYSQTKLETTDSTLRSYIQTAYEYVRNIVCPDQEVNTAERQNSLLGRLSMAQVLKGYDLLEELEQILKKSRMKAQLWALSSKYYAAIPHDVGKERLSNIETTSKIEQERKFLLTEFVLPVLS